MTNLKMSDKKTDAKLKGTKKKRDWVGIVHRGCRICIFRTIEAVIAFLVISILTLIVGGVLLPALSFNMATGIGITQSTHIYNAIASWALPMLFFVLLITAAVFCVIRRFLKWIHFRFTNVICKGNANDIMKREGHEI